MRLWYRVETSSIDGETKRVFTNLIRMSCDYLLDPYLIANFDIAKDTGGVANMIEFH